MISLKIARKDLKIISYLIGILCVLYSLKFPNFAEEIIIGILSSILATIVLDPEALIFQKQVPEEVSRLSSIEKKVDEALEILKQKK